MYRPDDSYVQGQLQEIMSILSEQEHEAEFTSYVDTGEQFGDAGRLNEAREAFQLALPYQHDKEVEHYITQISFKLAVEEGVCQNFHAHRVRGDLLFQEARYADAASSYRQTLPLTQLMITSQTGCPQASMLLHSYRRRKSGRQA